MVFSGLWTAQAQTPAPAQVQTPATAQATSTATLRGHIADQTGAMIPGAKITITNALGVLDQYFYDADQRLTQVLRASQFIRSSTYYATNRVRSYTDASGMTRIFDYNDLDQVTRVTYPDSRFESYAYSTCCPRLLDSETDRGGRTVTYSYDTLKRLTQVVNSDGGVTAFGYDGNGNPVSMVDPSGNATSFAYDRDNRVIRRTFPDGTANAFEWDVGGLLSKRTNGRGVAAQFTYDANHNLARIAYSDDTPWVTNTFDALNRVIQVVDGAGLRTFGYDANSRLTDVAGPWPNSTVTSRNCASVVWSNVRTPLKRKTGRLA